MDQDKNISLSRMMSSPGLKYKDKVFAFYYNNAMVFKLGKEYDPASDGITDYSVLNPFKNKPPLAGWFIIPIEFKMKWFSLSTKALACLKNEMR